MTTVEGCKNSHYYNRDLASPKLEEFSGVPKTKDPEIARLTGIELRRSEDSKEKGPGLVSHDPNNLFPLPILDKVILVAMAFFLSLVIPFVGAVAAAFLLDCKTPSIKNVELIRSKHLYEFHDPLSLALRVEEHNVSSEKFSKFHLENDRRLLMGVFWGKEKETPQYAKETSTFAAKEFKKHFDQFLNLESGNVQLAFQKMFEYINIMSGIHSYDDEAHAVVSYLDKASNCLYTATIGSCESNIKRSREKISLVRSSNKNKKLGSHGNSSAKITSIQVRPEDEICLNRKKENEWKTMITVKVEDSDKQNKASGKNS